MANTYTWTIIQLPCYPEHQGQEAVVFNVIWRYNGTDGNGHFGEAYGSTPITFDPNAPFTPFPQLQESTVIGWVEAALGVDGLANLQNFVDREILLQMQPRVYNAVPPWPQPQPVPDLNIQEVMAQAIAEQTARQKLQS